MHDAVGSVGCQRVGELTSECLPAFGAGAALRCCCTVAGEGHHRELDLVHACVHVSHRGAVFDFNGCMHGLRARVHTGGDGFWGRERFAVTPSVRGHLNQ